MFECGLRLGEGGGEVGLRESDGGVFEERAGEGGVVLGGG